MVKDPICGMEVNPDKTKYELFFKGQMYYFCCEHCLNEFQRKKFPLQVNKGKVREIVKKKIEKAQNSISTKKNAFKTSDENPLVEEGMFKIEALDDNVFEDVNEEIEEKHHIISLGKKKKKKNTKLEIINKDNEKDNEKDDNHEISHKGYVGDIIGKLRYTSSKNSVDDKVNIKESKENDDYIGKISSKDKTSDMVDLSGVVGTSGVVEKSDTPEIVTKTIEYKDQETIPIKGMHCASCAITIEKGVEKLDGVGKVHVNFASETAVIQYDGKKSTKRKIEKKIKDIGYEVKEENPFALDHTSKKETTTLIFSIILAIPLLYLGMAPHFGFPFYVTETTIVAIEMILALLLMIIGHKFYYNGIIGMIKNGRASMDTLIAFGTIAAFAYSLAISFQIWKGDLLFGIQNIYYEVAGVLIAIIIVGRYLESMTKHRVNHAIHKLISLVPDEAFVERDEEEYRVKVNEIELGDIVIVEPGMRIPVDGIVISGESTIDESIVTGEMIPQAKVKGSKLISGSVNKTGTLKFTAEKVGSETFLSQIIKLVKDAQGSKAPIQKTADKVSAYFVPIVFLIAIISFATWFFLTKQIAFPMLIFVAVLIVACPCALGLATPTAVIMGIGLGAAKGILVKNAEALQIAKDVNIVVFDKTGTITKGKPQVTNYIGVGKFPKDAVLQYAAIAEKRSEHPVGKAIVQMAQEQKMAISEPKQFLAHSGLGVEAVHNSKKILIGSKKLFKDMKINIDKAKEHIEYYEKQGKTVMILAIDKRVSGVLAVTDTIKENAVEAISMLHKSGKRVILLSGDHERTANAIAKQVGIEEVIADVLPSQKENVIKRLQKEGKKVAMVGDGINDAPSLAQADIGIAIGSGTDIAAESSDTVLVKDNLMEIGYLFRLSKYTIKKIKQNLFWAFCYNIIAIPLAAGVLYPFTGYLLNPMIAGAAMGLSSVSVVMNSLLMKRFK